MGQLQNLIARPSLYYNIDGLGELGGGLMFLGVGLLLSLPASSGWHKASWMIWLILAFGIHYGIDAIKTHITYPRTGFVEYRTRDRRRNSVLAAIAGTMVPIGLTLAMLQPRTIATFASLPGLILAAVYAYRVARGARWKWVVASAIAFSSIAIGFLPPQFLAGLANDSIAIHPVRAELGGIIVASFVTYGLLLLISGSITFWLYLRHTHAPSQDGQ